MAPRIRVLISDPQPLIADAIAISLDSEPDLEILEVRPSAGPDLIEAAWQFKPKVAVFDYWMDMRGDAATRMIMKKAPKCRVLLISWLHTADDVNAGLDAGAAGFLPRTGNIKELAHAIRMAASGASPVFAQETEALVGRATKEAGEAAEDWKRISAVTPRELKILDLLSAGRRIDEICEILSIHPTTARTHVQNILRKMDAHSQLEAVSIARNHGLIRS